MDNLINKGRSLSNYLFSVIDDINNKLTNTAIKILTPRNEHEKGCQVSMLVPDNGKYVFDTLTKNGVFADWREPDVIRIAPAPLYNSFEEIWRFGKILKQAFDAE